MKNRKNHGFSLVEVLVAIAIIGLITIPMTSGMLFALKTMARTEELMQAQLAVSSAVEELMAEGYPTAIETPEGMTIAPVKEHDTYYRITVAYDSVEVTTYVRANNDAGEAGGGG